VFVKSEPVVNGFITFIHVDENSNPLVHGLTIDPITEEDKRIQKTAIKEIQRNLEV
jgi:acyl-CoA hydrolase